MNDSASPLPATLDERPTLAEVLADAPAPAPAPSSAQDRISAIVTTTAAQAEPGACSGTITFSVSDPQPVVENILAELAGRVLGLSPIWLILRRPATGTGVLFAISAPNATGNEADLVVVGHPGMLNRSVLRAAARWAFYAAGLGRVVCRIPVEQHGLADYARRAGFRHEGTARDFFGTDRDAGVWAMTARTCPWLSRLAPTTPAADTPPPSSLRMH